MKYITFLILFGILFPGQQALYAQEQRYRVELLVLRHLEGTSAPQPVTVLTDFSSAMDLLVPPPEDPPPATADSPANPGGNSTQPPILLQEKPGEVMQQAWQRLRGTNGLRPELYFSWEQAASAGSPKIRIHDTNVVFEPDPYANVLDPTVLQPAGEARANPERRNQEGGEVNAEPGPEDSVPGLVQYFRLDGTASLRVSRFLRLYLDIEFRETADAAPQGEPVPAGDDTLPAKAYTVHTIRQSRQLHIQDLQYFDGPVIAVLATVSRVEPLPEETQ